MKSKILFITFFTSRFIFIIRNIIKLNPISTSVRILNEKHIKAYILNNNQTLEITLEVFGTIMNNFYKKNETFDVYYLNPESGLWSRAKINKEIISKYSLIHR